MPRVEGGGHRIEDSRYGGVGWLGLSVTCDFVLSSGAHSPTANSTKACENKKAADFNQQGRLWAFLRFRAKTGDARVGLAKHLLKATLSKCSYMPARASKQPRANGREISGMAGSAGANPLC